MHEIEVKLSAMHFGVKKKGIVLGNIEAVLCECILWRNVRHSGKFPLIPEKCCSYSRRATFRVGISATYRSGPKCMKNNIFKKIWKKVWDQGLADRVGRVVRNTGTFFWGGGGGAK